jgi:hypothetical protein
VTICLRWHLANLLIVAPTRIKNVVFVAVLIFCLERTDLNDKIINPVEKSIRGLGNPGTKGTNNSDLIPDLSNHNQ